MISFLYIQIYNDATYYIPVLYGGERVKTALGKNDDERKEEAMVSFKLIITLSMKIIPFLVRLGTITKSTNADYNFFCSRNVQLVY